jgi:Lon protease-like protein
MGAAPDESPEAEPDLSSVPLFPLPGVVLFPRAILPLHIFEERYKTMTADVLAGDKQLAMALLKPGWEKEYYQKPAIEAVVCVGTVLTHEKLADGKYNFLLQGTTRARIVREHPDTGQPYRIAELEPIAESPIMEIDLSNERQRMTCMFDEEVLSATSVGRQFRQMLSSPLSTADIADLIAFNILEDIPLKQSLLAESDVRKRVSRTIGALEQMRPLIEAKVRRVSRNASLN